MIYLDFCSCCLGEGEQAGKFLNKIFSSDSREESEEMSDTTHRKETSVLRAKMDLINY
jgi:hypothetical protein